MYESRRKLPCPCGRKRLDVYFKWYSEGNIRKHVTYIKCPKCGLQTDICSSKMEAIRRWNRLVGTIKTIKEDPNAEADNP